MAAAQSSSRRRKTCFVTIGATTGFQDLISAVLHPDFAAALVSQQYTHLLVQHGLDGTESFKSESENLSRNVGSSLSIDGFGVDPNGLDDYFALAKGAAAPGDIEGVVISHAGKYFLSTCLPETDMFRLRYDTGSDAARIVNHCRPE